MNKYEKKALKTGVDENNNALKYVCPTCGWEVSLMPKRCPKCGGKRPKNAYYMALDNSAKAAPADEPKNIFVDRSCGKLPAPKSPCFSAVGVEELVKSCYATDAMAQLGIPKYYSSDEYGRIFETPVCYKTLPGGGPVPIPKPSAHIQTEAITVPVSFTPSNN